MLAVYPRAMPHAACCTAWGLSLTLQAVTNVSIHLSDGATMRPVPYLLKLPAAASRLPHASLQAVQRCNSSDMTVHWHQNLTVVYDWVAERIDVDLMASGAVVHLQQPPTPGHISALKGESL